MRSLNKLLLIGNLGDDPEIKYTATGKKLANIRLATTEKWKDKQTEQDREETQWHAITLWEWNADLAEKYFKKGMRLYVEGTLKYSKSTDDAGETKYFTNVTCREVMMLDRAEGGARESGGPSPAESRAKKAKAAKPETQTEDRADPEFDDDIPF